MESITTLSREQFIEHVEHLTHDNLQTEALIAIAAYFKQHDLVDAFERHLSEQAARGYMTEEAIARRDTDKSRLLDSIELMHGEHERKLFRSLL